MRVAAIEDNVAFLEEWCEEQQDTLDRNVGTVGYDYETDAETDTGPEPERRAVLRVVDLRDTADSAESDEVDMIVAVVETEHDRKVRQLRTQINRLRMRLAASMAPPDELPSGRRAAPAKRPVSVRTAGRTAP